MIKRLVPIAVLISLFLIFTSTIKAEDETCTQYYGGGVVCGATHEVVNTGIEDILNPFVLGFASLGASGILLVLSKKIKSR